MGISDYKEVWDLQKHWVRAVAERRAEEESLILVEHPETVTVGRKHKGFLPADAFEIERGGEATLHNPGQLVAYPILRLDEGERDLHAYLRKLEEVLIQTLRELGLASDRKSGATGVWVDAGRRKIASIGVAVSHWVTYHGVALNVCNDLSAFQRINPCGFEWTVMTSMERELARKVRRVEVEPIFCRVFEGVFTRQLHCRKSLDLLSSPDEPANG